MSDVLIALLGGVLAGVALSGASHAALWWTVRRVPRARRPARLLALSSFARIALVALGLASLAWASPWALLGGAVGFLAVRTIAVARLGPDRRDAMGRAPSGREGRP
mgnify:CR=1 FL=1